MTHYFSQLTSAEPGAGDKITTTANLPDGRVVSADAWFRVNEDSRRIDWGSTGPSEYLGYLHVVELRDGSRVDLNLHTARVLDGNRAVQHGIDEALSNIKRMVEQPGTETPTNAE
ncbi:hypothetical protein [uncultured Mycobacterium sp.]|uniref:hypothetical protein n=1 Tax=uncultured Mycobacterium sp. TaxID=171292 RepID=UPI0035C9516D